VQTSWSSQSPSLAQQPGIDGADSPFRVARVGGADRAVVAVEIGLVVTAVSGSQLSAPSQTCRRLQLSGVPA
jgi:hypothetical protein